MMLFLIGQLIFLLLCFGALVFYTVQLQQRYTDATDELYTHLEKLHELDVELRNKETVIGLQHTQQTQHAQQMALLQARLLKQDRLIHGYNQMVRKFPTLIERIVRLYQALPAGEIGSTQSPEWSWLSHDLPDEQRTYFDVILQEVQERMHASTETAKNPDSSAS